MTHLKVSVNLLAVSWETTKTELIEELAKYLEKRNRFPSGSISHLKLCSTKLGLPFQLGSNVFNFLQVDGCKYSYKIKEWWYKNVIQS